MTATNPSLSHKDRTLQDIYDSMSPEQQELQDLILGAALEDEDLSGDVGIVRQYDALSKEQKLLIDFVVGGVLSQNAVQHSDPMVDNFLAHFGVKGMKWGVRRDTSRAAGQARLSKQTSNNPYARRELRDKVKGGSATLAEAHKAALKSTGHRALNAFLGDKSYWKGVAITAGVSGAVVGAAFAAPFVLPASTLAAIGTYTLGSAAAAASNSALIGAGATTVTAAGVSVAQIGSSIASGVLQVTNLARAVRGNARIDKSYAALGKAATSNQRMGNEKVQKLLKKQGGLRKKDLKHGSPELEAFLAHYADTPVKLAQRGS